MAGGRVLVLLAAAALLVVFAGFWALSGGGESAEEAPAATVAVERASGERVLRLASQPLLAGFVDGFFLFVNESGRLVRGGVEYARLALHVVSLDNYTVVGSIVVDEVPVQEPACEARGRAGWPRYGLLGFDGRYVYLSRVCPPRDPYPGRLLVADTVTGRVYDTSLSARGVAAYSGGRVLVYDDGVFSLLDAISGAVVWSHNYTPSYVFPEPASRRFAEKLLAAWPAGDGFTAVFYDRHDYGDTILLVYCVVAVGPEGLQEKCHEALRYEHGGRGLRVHGPYAVSSGGAIYVYTAILTRGPGWEGIVALHGLGMDGDLLWRVVRSEGFHPDGRFGVLGVDGEGVVVYYTLAPRIVVTSVSGREARMEVAPLVVEKVGAGGGRLWLLDAGGRIPLAYADGVVYLYRSATVYASRDGGEPVPVGKADLRRRPGLEVLVMPVLLPLLPFMEKPGVLVYVHSGVLHVFQQGVLRGVELDLSGLG